MSGEDLPAGWVLAPLGQLAEACLGKMLDKSKNRGSLHPYLRNQNVRWGFVDLSDVNEMPFEASEAGRFGLRVGDVLVCEGGEPGRAAVWRSDMPEMRFQKAIHRVRCGEALLPDWVVHSLLREAKLGRLTDLFTGTGIAHLTGVSLSKVQILLPPLPEQRRIVAKLDELRARSQKAREALDEVPALLEKLKQSVLAAAFRGDLTAEWRAAQAPGSVEPASVLLERIRAERRARWEQANPKKKYEEPEPVDTDGLPQLPEGWCWARLDSAVDDTEGLRRGPFGSALKKSLFVDSGPRVYEQGNVIANDFSRGRYRISAEYFQTDMASFAVRPGDILVTCAGTIGRVAMVPSDAESGVFNQALLRVRIDPQVVTPQYFMALFEHTAQSADFEAMKQGTALKNLVAIGSLRLMAIPVPPVEEQHRVMAALTLAKSTMLRLEKEVADLLNQSGWLDQAILAKAFRGELVPQDPADEPAEQLLARIQAEATAPQAKRAGPGRPRRGGA